MLLDYGPELGGNAGNTFTYPCNMSCSSAKDADVGMSISAPVFSVESGETTTVVFPTVARVDWAARSGESILLSFEYNDRVVWLDGSV